MRIQSTIGLQMAVIFTLIASLAGVSGQGQAGQPKIQHGGECDDANSTLLCEPDTGLACIYKTCSCITGEGYEYDAGQKRCLSKIEAPCSRDGDCVQGGQCIELFCKCKEGFSLTKDLHCTKPYGASCTASTECNKDRNMVCTSKKCGCEANYMLEENEASGDFCTSKISQPCDPNVDHYGFPNGATGKKCMDGAVCEKLPASGSSTVPSYKCACQEGVSVTDTMTCGTGSLLSFGFFVMLAIAGIPSFARL